MPLAAPPSPLSDPAKFRNPFSAFTNRHEIENVRLVEKLFAPGATACFDLLSEQVIAVAVPRWV